MTMFEDRERAFEQMFVHDEEARFRALARRNRMLGEWAAERMGLSGERARGYADEVTRSVVAAVVDEGLVGKIRADFEASGVVVSEDQIREKMAELMAKAIERVRANAW